jgi:hypothetical protein
MVGDAHLDRMASRDRVQIDDPPGAVAKQCGVYGEASSLPSPALNAFPLRISATPIGSSTGVAARIAGTTVAPRRVSRSHFRDQPGYDHVYYVVSSRSSCPITLLGMRRDCEGIDDDAQST